MKKITYKTAGVDVDKANDFVRAIKGFVKSTHNNSVLARERSFGGLFAFDQKKYKNPVLVSSTDGVGTKLLIAQQLNKHDTVGIDLVAMNVNDVLCTGAKPLFFLDYIACGKLDVGVLKDVIKGITDGCRLSGCSLIGGETAEMPGMYKPNEYDLAGFTVGVAERGTLIDGEKIKKGDVVLGLPSSGIHSNGYSLVRKALSASEQRKHAKVLLTPTRIYVREVLAILEKFSVKGIAHITGGAYYEKLTRILPKGTCFHLDPKAWPVPDIFQVVQKKGNIAFEEMYKTFNMGIGMVLVVSASDYPALKKYLEKIKLKYYKMGDVIAHKTQKVIFKR
jgi:phosphoribosylformylglycinamidine cyclo-ligase